ncbi:hypothetical protein DPMN_129932 [Dreissena polymorpha]|uniref:Transmembrane protein n=1 Tax=Dreissena polymorpha TaxID=45954 RepID=A0A9D4H6S4_DREPO|nr:hypothetical protein DPMN_129932 [Dreissena polymorpha]
MLVTSTDKTAPLLVAIITAPLLVAITNLGTKFHEHWNKNVTSSVNKSHVFQRTGTIFELGRHMIRSFVPPPPYSNHPSSRNPPKSIHPTIKPSYTIPHPPIHSF